MIEYNDEKYELKYTIPRIEKTEKQIGRPLLSVLIENNGAISINDLRTLYINGLRKEDDTYAGESIANKSFEYVLNQIGYAPLLEQVAIALQRDCPFFFPAD